MLGNFHLYDDGPHRNLQVFNDSDLKLLHVPSFGCRQNFTLNSTGSEVYTETQFSVGVKLYIADENNTRHYLRVNAAKDFAFELVCQDYVRNVSQFISGTDCIVLAPVWVFSGWMYYTEFVYLCHKRAFQFLS